MSCTTPHKVHRIRCPTTLITSTRIRTVRSNRSIRYISTSTQIRSIFEENAKKNNVSKTSDWYQIDVKQLDEKTAEILKKHYKGSMYRAMRAVFPEIEWHPWKFQYEKVPGGFWKEQTNQRKFFDDLGKKIGIQTLDDWYEKISQSLVIENGGSGLLFRHNQSPIIALMTAFPEHNWLPWKFRYISRGYWKDVSNQRKFFDNLGKQLGIQKLDDWYPKLSGALLAEQAASLLNQHNGSPLGALITAYPEHNWLPWKFNCAPMKYWTDPANCRRFFEELANQVGVSHLDDWYQKLSVNVIAENGGISLLAKHNRSPAEALMATFPEHKWYPWKFNTVPKATWKSHENVKQFLEHLSEKLSIQTLDDWYRVDKVQLIHFGAAALLSNGLYAILKQQYPHHPWDPKRFHQGGKKAQRWLFVMVTKMFPNDEILEDYIHPKITMTSSNRPLQLDVFLPSRNLAFEYQGIQHYEEVGVFSPSKIYQQRDEEKRVLCASNNIKLVEVPYWWNRTQESLQEMLLEHIPQIPEQK